MLNKDFYKNKKVIVTGGAGFIGSHLVKSLIEFGAKVLVIDDLSVGKLENIPEDILDKIIFHKVSVLNIDKLKELFQGYEYIFHLATQCVRLSINNPYIVHEVNTTGTLNICQSALENNLKKVVYISSSEVYGNSGDKPLSEKSPTEPTTIYGASKLTGEYYVKTFYYTHDLPYMIIRPFNTYGPNSHLKGVYGEVIPRFTLQLLNNKPPIIFGDGNQTRDFTYVTENINMILELSVHSGMTVNCAYGQDISVNEIAKILSNILDKKHITSIHSEERPGDINKLRADVNLMKSITGYNPNIDIKAGLKHYIEWFLGHYKNFDELLEETPTKNWEVMPQSLRV